MDKGKDFPEELKNCRVEDIKILKFIDIAEKGEKKGWTYDYRKRPGKYVIFKNYDKSKKILKEGLTAYIARANELVILNSGEEINKHVSTAHLNTEFDIHDFCSMLIGFPLTDEDHNVIGVLKIENYGEGKTYNYTKDSREVQKVSMCLSLLVRLIKSAEVYFRKNSYEQLFRGINLLEVLKNVASPSDKINRNIYEDTLHLFFVLKRKEYIGYEEILGRISGYVNDVSKHLELTEEIKSFNKLLEEFKKHEELLLYGLDDFRDHFMHQFHVFVSGYIIINELGIEEFRSKIQNNMRHALKSNIEISDRDVLRIWFLTALYHDYAYILEKIDAELSKFLKKILGYPFSVKFNWEQLLKEGSNFPKYLTQLLQFFVSPNGKTNRGTLLRNYLDAIIESHDHGVLSALLLCEYNSGATERRINECLYAGLAISVHTKNVYKNLMERNARRISFESFPIAFLLAFCDTAQSFGRLEKREGEELVKYPVKFSNLVVKDKKISYELLYTSPHPSKVPEDSDSYTSWADDVNNVFRSDEYCFDIKYYKEKEGAEELIYYLSFY